MEAPGIARYIRDMIGTSLPPTDEMYRAVVERDASYDGIFYVGVRTTGIFCRPTCPAKKPRFENIEFFSSISFALSAGYRPCRRCRPLEPAGQAPPWLGRLLEEVERDPGRRWTDEDLRGLSLSPTRVRRWFKAHFGMTFHAYHRAKRVGLAFARLKEGDDMIHTAYEHGYESLSGFRDAFARHFGRAPGRSASTVRMVTQRLTTPLGPMIAAATDEGVCLLEFADRRSLESQLERLHKRLGCVVTPGTNDHLAKLETELNGYFEGTLRRFTVPVLAPGTPFQEAVWKQLSTIPYGHTSSYDRLARDVGRPAARRAVGRANGDNRVAIVIPCHRVIRSDGQLCGYGGGLWRKRFLLEHERRHVRSGAEAPRPESLF